MKVKFVAGILLEGNKILLVKRVYNDPYMGNLWSLPGGGIEKNESPRKALIREFKEETNLVITILRKVYVLRKTSIDVVIFQVSRESGSLKSNDKDIEQMCFYDFDKLPEKIAIDSLLCILFPEIANLKLNEHFSIIIDKVFASIFYTYLNPQFQSYSFDNEVVIYKYIIESTPYRKFKSVVPFLLSKSNPEWMYIFIIPELCYAIWTLLDDYYDEKYYRYGIESSLKKYGLKMCTIALFKANYNLFNLLNNKISNSNINKIINSLYLSATTLYKKKLSGINTNIEEYLIQSTDRTEFLRMSWKAVLEESGYETKKIELVYDFQKQSSEIGQLINDYFDITRGDLEDYKNKIISMHWLLLYRESNRNDKKLLKSLWFGNINNKEKYQNLLIKYNIKDTLHNLIKEKLEKIIVQIQDSELNTDEKCILVAWHQMSFIHFKNEINDIRSLSLFLESIIRILSKY